MQAEIRDEEEQTRSAKVSYKLNGIGPNGTYRRENYSDKNENMSHSNCVLRRVRPASLSDKSDIMKTFKFRKKPACCANTTSSDDILTGCSITRTIQMAPCSCA